MENENAIIPLLLALALLLFALFISNTNVAQLLSL